MDPFYKLMRAAFLACASEIARFRRRWIIAGVLALAVVGAYTFSAPADFSANLVVIARGATTQDIAQELKDARMVRYPFLLELLLRAQGKGGSVQAGVYRFTAPQNLFVIARRLVAGDYGLPLVRMTFVEGSTVRDMAAPIEDAFPSISAADFSSAAKSFEGYLFPDTYFFSPSSTVETILKTMRMNFDAKTAPFSADIAVSGHSFSDLVIMASLVEKEARTSADKRVIAGILWNRLALGMPLQVDAVFGYIRNRDTYSPSFADLKTDSPYNTYLHTGLPPGPIDNPGLDSFEAVLRPTKTDYVYYLTGKDGVMHYATTYAAHQANQRKYLN